MEFEPITVKDILILHDTTINLNGGTTGILNESNVEGCIAKVTNTYFGFSPYEDIHSKATALLECLTKSHPFADGNKRTALQAIHLLLELNGLVFRPDEATQDRCKEVAQCKHDFDDLERWIRNCTSPRHK